VGVPLLGYQAIVSKDIKEGDLGILFGAETQLSLAYAAANGLHRHAELNADPSKKGYLEDNRRVKALKFRGHRSDALFMPLSSLSGFFTEWDQLKEGDTFDTLDGNEICRKYEIRPPRERGAGQQVRTKREPRVDERLFPKHFDTANYFRMADAIGPTDHVVITQKLHGTSIRIGHTLVQRKLTWRERIAKLLGVRVVEREWAYVYGSRNVVKDPDNPSGHDFYGTDLYSQIGSQLKGLLPKGFIVYGEVIGWVPDTNTPIQKGYTYRIPEGGYQLYIYRVTTINEDGRQIDLSWPAVQEFCASVGLDTVPELAGAHGYEIDEHWVANNFLDVRLVDQGFDLGGAVPTDGSMVDEGVCLRVEGITPLVLKAKSPEFLRHETKLLDQEVGDLEAVA
ncbi:RNA ligase family protein, partial [Plantactinospora sp. WMMB782]